MGYHKPLRTHETALVIEARIEGLSVPQLVARDVFIREGFSKEQATRLVSMSLSAEERNVNQLQQTMREHGWGEEQIEKDTSAFLDQVDAEVHRQLTTQPRKDTP